MKQGSLYSFFSRPAPAKKASAVPPPKPVAALARRPLVALGIQSLAAAPPASARTKPLAVAATPSSSATTAPATLKASSSIDSLSVSAAASAHVAHEGKVEDEAEPPAPPVAAAACEAPRQPPTPAAPKQPTAGLSSYERKRNARIARNRLVLANLGLEASKAEMERRAQHKKPKPKAKKRRAAPKKRAAPAVPARRSLRARGISANGASIVKPSSSAATAYGADVESEPEPEPEVFDDSDVLRYLCDGAADAVGDSSTAAAAAALLPAPGATRRFVEPRAADVPHGEFECAHGLRRIYSLHWWSSAPSAAAAGAGAGAAASASAAATVRPPPGSLLVAAGEKGLVDVFGLDGGSAPLASWKAHKGWIASARFVESGGSTTPRLLTASNDGAVALWDLTKVAASSAKSARIPKQLCVEKWHSNGVFSADTLRTRLCTASKDGTVGFATMTPDAVRLVRLVEPEAGGGVVKCARFDRRQPAVVAATGRRGDVWLIDERVAQRSGVVLTIEDAQFGKVVNSVRWCGGAVAASGGGGTALLATTGNDPYLRVWDVRALKSAPTSSAEEEQKPLWSFSGHSTLNASRCKLIYHALPVDGGNAIVAAGSQSDALSTYCVKTGKTLSRGECSWSSSAMAVLDEGTGYGPIAVAHSGLVSVLVPAS